MPGAASCQQGSAAADSSSCCCCKLLLPAAAAAPQSLRCPSLPPPPPQAIVQRMGGELDRFQAERAREMAYVLRDFAAAEARLGGETARVWASLLGNNGVAAG